MGEARTYFDSAAADYRKRSERFPWSWIRGREARAVDAAVGSLADRSVLDLGCGAGLYAGRALARGARRVVGVDLVEAMVRNLPPGVEGVVADAASLRLGETFDRVISAGLLEFVPDPVTIFATIEAHLGADGRAAILFPAPLPAVLVYQAFHLSHGVRIRIFNRKAIAALAAGVGMRILDFRIAGPFAGVAALAHI